MPPRGRWKLNVPQPPPPEERPPYNAADYPLGTTAEKDGVTWVVEWDEQDHRHMWVRKWVAE